MSAVDSILKFVEAHPGLVEAGVDLIQAMLAGDNKRQAQAQITLRRRVDAERFRAEAVHAAMNPSAQLPASPPVKVGRFVSAAYAKPKGKRASR